MRSELEAKMERTEMRMIMWRCGVSLRAKLRRLIYVEATIGDVMRMCTLKLLTKYTQTVIGHTNLCNKYTTYILNIAASLNPTDFYSKYCASVCQI